MPNPLYGMNLSGLSEFPLAQFKQPLDRFEFWS